MAIWQGGTFRFTRAARESCRRRPSSPPARTRTDRRSDGWSAGASTAPGEGSLALHEVHQDVVAEMFGRGEERSPPVDLGHLLDERPQRSVGAQPEGVDADLFLRAAHDLTQRGLDGLAHRWI